MLNRSLVKRFCAEDVTGLKLITEAAELAMLNILYLRVLDIRVAPIGRGAFYTGSKEHRKMFWTD